MEHELPNVLVNHCTTLNTTIYAGEVSNEPKLLIN